MKGLFWLLGLFALAAAVALGIRYNHGYALFVLPPWRMEITLNLLAILAAFAFFLGYLLLRGALLAASLPQRARRYREERRHARAERALHAAYRHYCAGRWVQALEFAESAWGDGRDGGAAALLAAQAARRLRRGEAVRQWLERAAAADAESAVAATLLTAEYALADGEAGQALADLARLQNEHGVHVAVLTLELAAHRALGDWLQVLRLVRQMAKHDALPAAEAMAMRAVALCGIVGAWRDDAASLCDYLAQLPLEDRRPEVLRAARAPLSAAVFDAAAEAALQRLLAGEVAPWNGELQALCGALPEALAVSGRLAWAEARLAVQPDDAVLLLALGRLCVRRQLWGKAERYLEAAVALAGGRAAHLELAHLLDHLERRPEAASHYQEAAMAAG
jgi:HemY protein